MRRWRWGPRTLDCDILLYGQYRFTYPDLHIPHPGLMVRPFVLIPLAEIAPDLYLPNGVKLSTVLSQCDVTTVEKLTYAIS